MLGEVTHLQAISDDLKALTSDPHKLPPASEQVGPLFHLHSPSCFAFVLCKNKHFHMFDFLFRNYLR